MSSKGPKWVHQDKSQEQGATFSKNGQIHCHVCIFFPFPVRDTPFLGITGVHFFQTELNQSGVFVRTPT